MKTRRLVLRLVYLIVVLAGAVALYVLIPDDVWQTLRESYWDTGAGRDAP